MKIGDFAKYNHTSIDTIRHYIDLQLINPEKDGIHYNFDDLCQEAFQEIQFLKSMGFLLKDITMILQYKRLGQLIDYEDFGRYAALFRQKHEALEAEIQKLQSQKHGLESYLVTKVKQPKSSESIGVPIEALPLLSCERCHFGYSLQEGHVEQGQILSGKLSCPCGQTMTIQSGILYGEDYLSFSKSTEIQQTFIDDYLQTTDESYIHKVSQSLEWSKRHVDFSLLNNKVAIELGSGHGFFLRHCLQLLPQNCLYIAVDHDPHTLLWLKSSIEKCLLKAKLLFLCTDFKSLPIKNASIDCVFDISGSSNYAFTEQTFLLEQVNPKLKARCILHGYYIIFKRFAFSSKIDPSYRRWFKRNEIDRELVSLGFEVIHDSESEPTQQGGPMEDYFVEGESVSSYIYYGQRG